MVESYTKRLIKKNLQSEKAMEERTKEAMRAVSPNRGGNGLVP